MTPERDRLRVQFHQFGIAARFTPQEPRQSAGETMD